MGKIVRAAIIAVFVLLQAFIGTPQYLLGGCHYWLRALTYSFFHASWWHLAVNAIALWSIYRYPCKPCRDLLLPFIIAVIVYPLSLRPVIGFSNVLYAVLGLRTPSLRSRWWRQPAVITFLAVTIALLFVPRFSATTHIAAFVMGMALAAIKRLYDNLMQDARRYL